MGVEPVAELIDELHSASLDARRQCFPTMARHLDECGAAFAELADDGNNERCLVERARRCLETWRAIREW